MLAPAGVRYVVLLTSLAPEITGEQTPQPYPVPSDLAPTLGRQLDLTPVVSGTGITVYDNAAWIPQRAELVGPRAVTTTKARSAVASVRVRSPGASIVRGARPVLPGPSAATSYHGPLAGGTVFTALAPADRWNLVQRNGSTAVRSPSFGWAGKYQVAEAGVSTLAFDGGPSTPLSLLYTIIVWLAAVAVVAARGLGGSWRRVRTGRRRPRADAADAAETAPADEEAPSDAGTPT